MFFRDSDRLCIAGDVLANLNFLTGKPRLREPLLFYPSIQPKSAFHPDPCGLESEGGLLWSRPPLRNPELLERFVAKAMSCEQKS